VPAIERFEKLQRRFHLQPRIGGCLGIPLVDAFAQQRQRRIDLALFAFLDDHAKQVGDVLQADEVIAAVAEHVRNLDQAPGLQFLQAGRDVGPSDRKRLGDLFGVQRPLRQVEQRMHLRDGAADAPARAHLAPVQHEFLGNRRQFHDFSEISVISEIT
jgi:hypothetical protein